MQQMEAFSKSLSKKSIELLTDSSTPAHSDRNLSELITFGSAKQQMAQTNLSLKCIVLQVKIQSLQEQNRELRSQLQSLKKNHDQQLNEFQINLSLLKQECERARLKNNQLLTSYSAIRTAVQDLVSQHLHVQSHSPDHFQIITKISVFNKINANIFKQCVQQKPQEQGNFDIVVESELPGKVNLFLKNQNFQKFYGKKMLFFNNSLIQSGCSNEDLILVLKALKQIQQVTSILHQHNFN